MGGLVQASEEVEEQIRRINESFDLLRGRGRKLKMQPRRRTQAVFWAADLGPDAHWAVAVEWAANVDDLLQLHQ